MKDGNLDLAPDNNPTVWQLLAAKGDKGPSGQGGVALRGTWNDSEVYNHGDMVIYEGVLYVSEDDGQANRIPGRESPFWEPLALSGGGGMEWKGPWTPGKAYFLNQAVQHDGASYVSLMNENFAEPQLNPGAWMLLAAKGLDGTKGKDGTNGTNGLNGKDGTNGTNGLNGKDGANGTNGLNGKDGATGPTGPAGLTWRQEWSSTLSYATRDAVSYQGSSYVSVKDGNLGLVPDGPSGAWQILAAKGLNGKDGTNGTNGLNGKDGTNGTNGLNGKDGTNGTNGLNGKDGANGTNGLNGKDGATGPAGLTWRQEWSSTVSYATRDAVSYQGSSYVSVKDGNLGLVPDGPSGAWQILAARGGPGDTRWRETVVKGLDTLSTSNHITANSADFLWYVSAAGYHWNNDYCATGAVINRPGHNGYLSCNENMVIMGDGRVGIGTRDPQEKVHIHSSNGGIRFTDQGTSHSWTLRGNNQYGNFSVYHNSDILFLLTNDKKAIFYTEEMHLSGKGYSTGGWINASDSRLKENISPLEGALDKILRLRGVEFDWRPDLEKTARLPRSRQIGFIAQEVEAVLPELVSKDQEGFLSLAYPNLTAVLVEAVKEQQAQIEKQTAELESQRREIASLNARLAAIEKRFAADVSPD